MLTQLLIMLTIALAVATFVIFRLALTILAQERHIDHLETYIAEQTDRIAWHVGYSTSLEGRNERLETTLNRYIVSIPTSSAPKQIEELRDRLKSSLN